MEVDLISWNLSKSFFYFNETGLLLDFSGWFQQPYLLYVPLITFFYEYFWYPYVPGNNVPEHSGGRLVLCKRSAKWATGSSQPGGSAWTPLQSCPQWWSAFCPESSYCGIWRWIQWPASGPCWSLVKWPDTKLERKEQHVAQLSHEDSRIAPVREKNAQI